jgi:hypothetical protein
MRARSTTLAIASIACLVSVGFTSGSAQAQTVIVNGVAPAPQAPAPQAPSATAAEALPAPRPGCVMVLQNGAQTECPVIVIQADQQPAQEQAPAAQPAPAPQPQAYAPQYVQPYPQYAPQQNRRLRRHRVRYTLGMDVPEGASIVEHRHMALLIPGIAIFAAHYLSVAFYGLSSESYSDFDSKNYIPVLGPLLTLNNADYHSGRSIRIYDSLMQGVGLALFIAGMHKTAYVEWRADSGVQRNFAFAPGASPDGASLNARLQF